MSYKLFIPGPVEVSAKTYAAMTTPVFGHRSQDFVDLYRAIQPRLQELFFTKDPVFLSTSSAWGVMEGALRNLVRKKVLCCMSGAFSDKWYDVALRCGKEAEALSFEWGHPVDPDIVRQTLSKGGFDAITLIHNETSTGTMNPLTGIMAVLRDFPEVVSIVDTVSSFSVLPIHKDDLGIDVMLTGSQKALALPPGMSLFSVSPRALQRAAEVDDRGYYFDFLEFADNHAKGMTPSTPTLPHIFALRSKLEDIFSEGVEARYHRHANLNTMVRSWGFGHGFRLLPEDAYGSLSLTCWRNEPRIDLVKLNQLLREHHGMVIDEGYGRMKGKTFRISNMGDETRSSMSVLLAALDEVLPKCR